MARSKASREKGILIQRRELPRFLMTGKVKTFGGDEKYRRRGTMRLKGWGILTGERVK